MPKPAGKPARSMAESGSAVERAGDLSPSANGASRVRLHRRRPELDDADRQLIALLTASGRMSTRALAAEVDLTEPTVAARLRKLADLRILGVTATLDWAAAGYRWDAWLQVSVHGRSVKEVGAQLARVESVDRVHVVFGAYDLLVHLLLSDESEAVAAIECTPSIAPIRSSLAATAPDSPLSRR